MVDDGGTQGFSVICFSVLWQGHHLRGCKYTNSMLAQAFWQSQKSSIWIKSHGDWTKKLDQASMLSVNLLPFSSWERLPHGFLVFWLVQFLVL